MVGKDRYGWWWIVLHPHPGSLTRTTSGLGFSQSLPHSRSRRRMFASAAAWLVSRRSGRRGYRVPCTRALRLGMRVSAGTQARQTHTTSRTLIIMCVAICMTPSQGPTIRSSVSRQPYGARVLGRKIFSQDRGCRELRH